MIICQYDINKLDLDVINQVMEYINNTIKDEKQTIITVPSGFTITKFADEEGLDILEKLYDFLGKNIDMIKRNKND